MNSSSMQSKIIHIKGQTFHLHPLKAIFWEEQLSLLIADLHLGKAAHFRKNGIPVPQGVSDANWDKLIGLLLDFKPKRVLFLGDLFHSIYNTEWEELVQLIQQFEDISFELVQGNHDILDHEFYNAAKLRVIQEPYLMDPFLLSHHPMKNIPEGAYNLAGHIHPAVRLKGFGRQSVRLACFYFGENQGILPAFGTFTGMATLEIAKGEKVFVIAEDQVIEV